jgi:exoribonuclease R
VARRVRLKPPDGQAIAVAFAELRKSLEVEVGFEPEVLADAETSARSPRLPERDETSIPFLTIDPADSQDLDQALHLERRGDGYRVRYAIADVAAFVEPGGPMDAAAHERGQTLYAPDEDALLYPAPVSHGAASLLPDGVRPAVLWTFDLDSGGEPVATEVVRARVRSRRKLSYEHVQHALDDGSADEPLVLLREVGRLRQELEEARGGIDLQIPEQEVEHGRSGYELAFRTQLPVERWNAQLSLLTGQEAARLMLQAKVGIVRTLPRADEHAVARLRRTANALGVAWQDGGTFADFVRSLDPAEPAHKAVLAESTVLLRGSGYEAFDGSEPENAKHAGVGAPYTHATAPLRRLVDRYASEVCLAVHAGVEVPGWARTALPGLPETMERSARRAAQYEGGVVSAVEAAVLAKSVGDVFPAVVVEIDRDGEGGVVQLTEPAVTARTTGKRLPLGERLDVRLVEADVVKRLVRFEPA